MGSHGEGAHSRRGRIGWGWQERHHGAVPVQPVYDLLRPDHRGELPEAGRDRRGGLHTQHCATSTGALARVSSLSTRSPPRRPLSRCGSCLSWCCERRSRPRPRHGSTSTTASPPWSARSGPPRARTRVTSPTRRRRRWAASCFKPFGLSPCLVICLFGAAAHDPAASFVSSIFTVKLKSCTLP